MHGVSTSAIPRLGAAANFALNIDAIVRVADERSIVFLATPNNPTGVATPVEDVQRIADTGALVVVDEAYGEFVEALDEKASPFLALIENNPNIVVMRTLSKWAGLAGLRIGYAVAHPTIISAMMKAKQPYNINCVAEAAALKALEMKAELTKKGSNVHIVAVAAKSLVGQIGSTYEWLSPVPTDSNFVLCQVHGFDAESVAKFCSLKCHGSILWNAGRGAAEAFA